MARTMDVYLQDKLAGHLVQDRGGQMIYRYSKSWLEGPGATSLSKSLPLRLECYEAAEVDGGGGF
jgi:HipA-like protein